MKIVDIIRYKHYAISDKGEVYSFVKYKEGRAIKQKTMPNGYKLVQLGRRNYEYVHRLVAEVFIPNPENKKTVNHINGIKSDNRVDNLEWNTYSENHKHAYNNGRIANNGRLNNFGKDCPSSKRISQYSIDDNFIRHWYGVNEINRELGFNKANINSCCNNKRKTAHKFKWKYE